MASDRSAPDRPALTRTSPVVSARLAPADRDRLAVRLDAEGVPVAVFVRGLILDALDADRALCTGTVSA
ncbi:hypothetical protein B1759_18950 [Rubrivirga sp. SAORIC476]|uniref:hypothetical protein n=1 Tax=Rubrivirga sp. SAORIC476 TaxID=1961794 RepID=UPI000BA9BF3C|nr:hypothetical protein [Rubrivirga sp. SAORIC476]PAP74274.1 hypothetical protein B1759_18950 [Rubrivirga sp. SAORIC476]